MQAGTLELLDGDGNAKINLVPTQQPSGLNEFDEDGSPIKLPGAANITNQQISMLSRDKPAPLKTPKMKKKKTKKN